MKKWIIALLAAVLVFSSAGASAAGDQGASQNLHATAVSLNQVKLTLVDKSCEGSTETSMPWGSSLTFMAEVMWSDGIVARDDFGSVDWTVTDQMGQPTQVWKKTWFDDRDKVARIKIFAPYGMIETLKLSAVSQKDPSLSDGRNIQVVDGTKTRGTRYFNGRFGFDPPETESWDAERGIYSTTLGGVYEFLFGYKDYIPGSFCWIIYVGEYLEEEDEYYVEYQPNSRAEMSVDQNESCRVQPQWGTDHGPIIDPPVIYKYYKVIGGVRTEQLEDSVRITWNRVSGVRGYIIYRYDGKTKKYKKVGVRNGISKFPWTIPNAFTDTKVSRGKSYSYKVSSYKYVKGKVKVSKKSGFAGIVYRSGKYGNATKVALSRTKPIKGKAGARVKLKASLTFESGKKPWSKSVRWYTNNKRIATVSKTGVVTFRKKGKCSLFAKAHNGVKSKTLVIQVL